MLVRGELVGGEHVIAMYKTDGTFVRRFGKGKTQEAFAVTARTCTLLTRLMKRENVYANVK